jgi:hypothetical protein
LDSKSFVFWLQGYFELSNSDTLTPHQVKLIKQHLNLVFKHDIDPSMGNEEHQQVLNEIHSGGKDKFHFPINEAEAIELWGPKPSPNHVFNIHGWYNPAEGVFRC